VIGTFIVDTFMGDLLIQHHARRDEGQELRPVVLPLVVPEEVPENGNVAEQRNLVGCIAFGLFVDAADDHRTAVLGQDLGFDPGAC
jgi:hypothetical protein